MPLAGITRMKWRLRKSRDPRKGGSAKQQKTSLEIDEQLRNDSIQLRKTIKILVLGTPSASARFVEDFENEMCLASSPRVENAQEADSQGMLQAETERVDSPSDDYQDFNVVGVPSQESGCFGDPDLAELAEELHRMRAFSEYKSLGTVTHEVDLVASSYLIQAMHLKGTKSHRSAFRCGTDPELTAIENLVRHQTSTIDSRSLPARGDPSSRDFTLYFRILGEHSPAHPKTHGFFEDCSSAIFVLDVNTLHEIHPIGKVRNVEWAMQRIRTLGFRTSQRLIYYAFSGVTEFRKTMASRSADDYLASIFDDYNPEGNITRHDPPWVTMLTYVMRRFQAHHPGGQCLTSFLGGDKFDYVAIREAIIEWNTPCLLVCQCF